VRDTEQVLRFSRFGSGRTGLLTCVHLLYDRSRPAESIFGLHFMEFGDFEITRRMPLGIKERGGAHVRPPRNAQVSTQPC
jgi:hypothetical protein